MKALIGEQAHKTHCRKLLFLFRLILLVQAVKLQCTTIFIRLIEMKPNAKRFYLTIFLLVILLGNICFIVRYMFFCAIFDHQIRMKTKQIRKKRYFPLSLYGGTLNFPLGEAKSQWEDANYRWEDASLILFKYWLYFHLQVMTLLHYYDTATVRNQHQLLTC